MFDAPDGLKGYVGEEDGFDPLKLSSAFDMVRRPPALPQAARDAMLGVCTCLMPSVAAAGLCRLPVPPETAGLSACVHQSWKQYRVGGQSGRLTCCRLAWHGTPTGPCRA